MRIQGCVVLVSCGDRDMGRQFFVVTEVLCVWCTVNFKYVSCKEYVTERVNPCKFTFLCACRFI